MNNCSDYAMPICFSIEVTIGTPALGNGFNIMIILLDRYMWTNWRVATLGCIDWVNCATVDTWLVIIYWCATSRLLSLGQLTSYGWTGFQAIKWESCIGNIMNHKKENGAWLRRTPVIGYITIRCLFTDDHPTVPEWYSVKYLFREHLILTYLIDVVSMDI